MNEVIQWHTRTVARYQTTDWIGLLHGAGFVDVGVENIEWNQPITRELLASRVRSVSYVADEPPEVQQDYVDRVLAVVDGFDETFPPPYVARVWFGKTS